MLCGCCRGTPLAKNLKSCDYWRLGHSVVWTTKSSWHHCYEVGGLGGVLVECGVYDVHAQLFRPQFLSRSHDRSCQACRADSVWSILSLQWKLRRESGSWRGSTMQTFTWPHQHLERTPSSSRRHPIAARSQQPPRRYAMRCNGQRCACRSPARSRQDRKHQLRLEKQMINPECHQNHLTQRYRWLMLEGKSKLGDP